MKIIFLTVFLLNILFAETKKVYFYTTESNINNFKSLKVGFDTYLSEYGDYEFQPFSDKKTFEKYLKNKDSIVILSSWHYRKISKEYNLEAILIAQKKSSITDTKILVGQNNITYKGIVTSAFDKEYANELLSDLIKKSSQHLSVLVVPKEIDALMSVGFGMSKFALVSKDSFTFLQEINPFLSDNLKVYNESMPKYRMILAKNKIDTKRDKLVSIFKNMGLSESGKKILNMIGVDKLVVLTSTDLKNIGGTR